MSKRMTIHSCGTRIDTPASLEAPVIRRYCLIASVPFQPQNGLQEEGRATTASDLQKAAGK